MALGDGRKTYQLLWTLTKTGQHKTSVIKAVSSKTAMPIFSQKELLYTINGLNIAKT